MSEVINKAIAKVNEDMQKTPDDTNLEILGHYIIERCSAEAAAALVLEDGKSLKGCMDKIIDKASRKKEGNRAVLTDKEVFDAADRYFGFSRSEPERDEIRRQVDGAREPVKLAARSECPPPESGFRTTPAVQPVTAPGAVSVNLSDFF